MWAFEQSVRVNGGVAPADLVLRDAQRILHFVEGLAEAPQYQKYIGRDGLSFSFSKAGGDESEAPEEFTNNTLSRPDADMLWPGARLRKEPRQ